jgi:hypothetical protein
MKRRIALATLFATLALPLVKGQFGPAIPVIDYTAILKLVKQIEQLQQEYQQLVTTYQFLVAQSRQLASLPSAYRSAWSVWLSAQAPDTYLKNVGWIQNANGANGTYPASAIPLPNYGAALGQLALDTQNRLQWHYAAAQLSDGVNQESLNALGVIRATGPGTQAAIQNLESRTFSAAPEDNTAVAVANKQSIAGLIQARQQQDTNRLLVTLVEQQALAAKIRRDQIAADAADYNQQLLGASDVVKATANASYAIQSFHF